jgi:signal transduction histidine kinase
MALTRFISDVAFHAIWLSLLACFITIRANPRRNVNIFFALFCALTACWQFIVMMARVTGEVGYWAPKAIFVGPCAYALLFLLHESVMRPGRFFGEGLLKRGLVVTAVSTAMVFVSLLVTQGAGRGETAFEDQTFTIFMRVSFLVVLLSTGIFYLRSSFRSPSINRHEVFLFNFTSFTMYAVFAVYVLVRTPGRSVGTIISSSLCVVLMLAVLVYQWQDRVLDTKASGRIATVWACVGLVHFALLFFCLSLFHRFLGEDPAIPVWALTFATLGINTGLMVLIHPIVSQRLSAFASRSSEEARRTLAEKVSRARLESEVLEAVETVSAKFVGGLQVKARILLPAPESGDSDSPKTAAENGNRPNDPLTDLAALAEAGFLTEFTALRLLRGEKLKIALALMAQEKIGAVVRRTGDGLWMALFVGERGGGSRSFSQYELEQIHELAGIALAGIVRVRAVDSSLRAQSHAVIGQVVSQFNHESRNQIDSIKLFLATLEDPDHRKQITVEHLRMIQDTCESLSHGYDTVLAMAAMRSPDQLKRFKPTTIVHKTTIVLKDAVSKAGAEFSIIEDEFDSEIMVDDLTLRRVLINLVQNSLQAMTLTAKKVIRIQITTKGDRVHIIVEDNGPGIPVFIYDNMFTPWATSKSNGTGLGLSSCKQWITQMGGTLNCLSPRGAGGAIFDISFPRMEPSSVVLPGPAWVV